MVGRTHGIHAEPITFGLKLAGWVRRDWARPASGCERGPRDVASARSPARSAPTPTSTPGVEEYVCREAGPGRGRGLHPGGAARPPRRVLRDPGHHRRLAGEDRHRGPRTCSAPRCWRWRSPSARARRAPRPCPTSATPSSASDVCGLARLLRGYAVAALENVALWHERDISHSSVERVIIPDATIALDYMLSPFTGVIDGLQRLPGADDGEPGQHRRPHLLRSGCCWRWSARA